MTPCSFITAKSIASIKSIDSSTHSLSNSEWKITILYLPSFMNSCSFVTINPNKAGLFEGSFSWRGEVNLTPPLPSPSYFNENSMKFLGKMCLKIILKVTKNQGFTFSLKDTFFEKPQGGGQFDPSPPAISELNQLNLLYLFTQIIIVWKIKGICAGLNN